GNDCSTCQGTGCTYSAEHGNDRCTREGTGPGFDCRAGASETLIPALILLHARGPALVQMETVMHTCHPLSVLVVCVDTLLLLVVTSAPPESPMSNVGPTVKAKCGTGVITSAASMLAASAL